MFTCDLYAGVVPQMSPPPHDLERLRTKAAIEARNDNKKNAVELYFLHNGNDINYNLSPTDWNKDWKPGPYPRTPRERAAAAKKYNLRVEDYEPYPNDGFGYGDYPKLPHIADEAKSPYEPYDAPHNRRFYGEPVRTYYYVTTKLSSLLDYLCLYLIT